jgi:hypothetical protein
MAAVPSTSASLREGDSAWVILVSMVILDIFKLRFLHQSTASAPLLPVLRWRELIIFNQKPGSS